MAAVTTLVSLIGKDAGAVAERVVHRAANVSIGPLEIPADGVVARAEQLLRLWKKARSHGPVYTLVAGDPLAFVVSEWAARLGGGENDLETAIGLAPKEDSPDYYLVDVELAEPEIHWYLGFLPRLAPRRILPGKMTAESVLASLRNLPAGLELPPLNELAAAARDYVPLPAVDVAQVTPG